MNTFRDAPRSAALQNVTPTPASEIARAEPFAAKGSALAISDAGVGVTFCKAALLGASLNVFINTKSMADKEYAASLNEKADKMIADYSKKADEIFAAVNARLR